MRVDVVNAPGHQWLAARGVEVDDSSLCSHRVAGDSNYHHVGKQSGGMVRGACVLMWTGELAQSTDWAWGRLWASCSARCWALAAEERDDGNSAAERTSIFLTWSSQMNGLELADPLQLRLVGVRERGLLGGRTWSTDGADDVGPP